MIDENPAGCRVVTGYRVASRRRGTNVYRASRLPGIPVLIAALFGVGACAGTAARLPAVGSEPTAGAAPALSTSSTVVPAGALPRIATEELVSLQARHRVTALTRREFTHHELWTALGPVLEGARGLRSTVVGRSAQGRPIYRVDYGNGPVRVLLWSQMHGDESTATMALADIIRFLAEDPGHPLARRLAERLTIAMIPMLNPDGAEHFQRRNALGIDVNRDARMLATPEARVLKGVKDTFDPAFGFNLHDQNVRTRVGDTERRVAMAFLAPPYDESGRDDPVRLRAKRLAALMRVAIEPLVGGHIARYDDTFNPRAFGDLMTRWGVSTVLIESGGWEGDPQKQYLRQVNFVAILTALDAIASGSYRMAGVAEYELLPENGRAQRDLLVLGGTMVVPGLPAYRADLMIDFARPLERSGGRIEDIGDLDGFTARDTLDLRGLFIHPAPAMLTRTESGAPSLSPGAEASFVVRRGEGPDAEVVRVVEGGVVVEAAAAAGEAVGGTAVKVSAGGAALAPTLDPGLVAQNAPASMRPRFTIEQVLSPAFAYGLAAARGAERIAWLENERGARNVYTAAAPDFRPVRLTGATTDDGVDLSGLQISDDGSVVVFMRGHAPNREGWVANPTSDPAGAERAAWAVRTSGGEPWRVVEARDVSLAPDGRSVLYLQDGQVHRAPVEPRAGDAPGGEPVAHSPEGDGPGVDGPGLRDGGEPLFRAFGRTVEAVWSPDSRKIAFVSDRESHSFVGVYDLDARRITYLAPGVDRDLSPAWSPDGRRVAFIRTPGRTFGAEAARGGGLRGAGTAARRDGVAGSGTGTGRPGASPYPPGLVEAHFPGGHTVEIWIADVATGEGSRLWHPPASDSAANSLRRISWVGEHLLFQLEPGEWQRYYSLAVASPGTGPVALTHEEGMPEQIATSADGRYLYFATNHGDIDRRHIWRVPLAGGKAQQVTEGDEIETYPAVLASGERLALLRAGVRQPQTVAIVAAGGGKPRLLASPPAEFPQRHHVAPHNVTLTAADGVQFHNQLFLPPDLKRGERRPALIFIHGGPRRQMLLGYNYGHFYHMAYAINQYFANRGYVVLSVNYRGGIGYGQSFRDAPDRGRSGNSEYQDLLAAGLYLRERPDVDPERIGLWGLSYGGILTAQGLARNSEIFAAGVDIAGVHSWGNPLEPESVAHRSSSISEIERWRSPVLLVHGDDDRNVAFSQTVGLVQLLRGYGIPFELIVFPDDVHSFLLHERWLRTFRAADDFFERTLIRREPIRTEVAAAGRGRP